MSPEVYSSLFKLSSLVLIIPSILVIATAVFAAREMGGTLGQGLKKTAAGTIIHTILLVTYMLLEHGYRGMLGDAHIRYFFIVGAVVGSFFLISGYVQIYRITKRLKLFTVH